MNLIDGTPLPMGQSSFDAAREGLLALGHSHAEQQEQNDRSLLRLQPSAPRNAAVNEALAWR